jgi:hypothetical protein
MTAQSGPIAMDSETPANSTVRPADAVYAVSEIDLSNARDISGLFELWDAVYPGVLARKFEWLYRNGPAGPARVWVIRASDGAVAGAATVFPRQVRVEGVARRAGLAGDFLIHPGHRVLGPAMSLQRRICADATKDWVEFLYGFPNLTAEGIFLRAGFTPLARRMRWVMPIRTAANFLELSGGATWGPVAAPVADQALRFGRWISGRTPGIRYRESSEVDDRFEQIWNHNSRLAKVAIERSATYLRWRYLDAPVGPFTVIEALSTDGALLGYAIGRIVEGDVEVCELVAEDPATRGGLTLALWRWGRLQGAQRLEHFVGENTFSAAQVSPAGFVERPCRHRVLIYIPRDHADYVLLANPANWWLVQSDGDT